MSASAWDARFLALARHVASNWSKDPSTKCAAVIVGDDRLVLGLGYNGFPRGVSDDPALYADRSEKYPRIVHAEANAILNATRSVKGAAIFTWPLPPCSECAKLVIQAGIKEAVSIPPSEDHAMRLHMPIAAEMFGQAGVTLRLLPAAVLAGMPA